MLVKIVYVLVIFGVCFASGANYKQELPSPFYELPCTALGGICLHKNECPSGKEVGLKGLCPLQQDQGVECCYSVGKSATTCKSNGGECVSSSWQCPDFLTFSKAMDCESGEKCCIMVH